MDGEASMDRRVALALLQDIADDVRFLRVVAQVVVILVAFSVVMGCVVLMVVP